MPTIHFLDTDEQFTVESMSKVLKIAIKNKIPLTYGCAACMCGTCIIELQVLKGALVNEPQKDELELLTRLGYTDSSQFRLACQLRVLEGTIQISQAKI